MGRHHWRLIIGVGDTVRENIEQCAACSVVRHTTLSNADAVICVRFFRMGLRIEEPACRPHGGV